MNYYLTHLIISFPKISANTRVEKFHVNYDLTYNQLTYFERAFIIMKVKLKNLLLIGKDGKYYKIWPDNVIGYGNW
ncbi:hypothetical protein HYD44_00865 [Mycoplasmopsis bovis]|nr:hypothetical protein [Mycoplasmopsis bovis]QQH83694.1 hypothetical protein HYD44_00865 [Mycoplasmopsis bovis]